MLDYMQLVLAPQMLNALSIAVPTILVALGLTITFGLLDVINMAHGELYALGAFLGLSASRLGLGFWTLLPLIPLVMMPIGWFAERWLVQRVFSRPDRKTLTLLLTLGLSLVLEDAFKLLYGPNPHRPELPLRGGVELLGVFLPSYRLFLIAAGTAVIAAVWIIARHTRLGAIIRAVAWDSQMAAALGVPVERVTAGAFAFGVMLAGLAGVLLGPIYSVFPTMGQDFILTSFAVVIVGGMGSIPGTIVAGLLLTQMQSIATLYIPPAWSDPLVFALLILVLMVRPQGLFGRIGHA